MLFTLTNENASANKGRWQARTGQQLNWHKCQQSEKIYGKRPFEEEALGTIRYSKSGDSKRGLYSLGNSIEVTYWQYLFQKYCDCLQNLYIIFSITSLLV